MLGHIVALLLLAGAGDTTVVSCPDCPVAVPPPLPEWQSFDGSLYVFVKHPRAFDSARTFCKSLDSSSHLVSIHSQVCTCFFYRELTLGGKRLCQLPLSQPGPQVRVGWRDQGLG